MADSKEKLFSDFSPVSTEQWMEKVTADLKGADFEKKLVWRTNEGFKVKPFYRMEDLEGLKTTNALPGEFPYLRGTKKNNNEWFVRQEIKVECPKEANAKALDILNKGIDSLSFHVKAKELSAEYIETLLKDICAECVELNFSLVRDTWWNWRSFLWLTSKRKIMISRSCKALSTTIISIRCWLRVRRKAIW